MTYTVRPSDETDRKDILAADETHASISAVMACLTMGDRAWAAGDKEKAGRWWDEAAEECRHL